MIRPSLAALENFVQLRCAAGLAAALLFTGCSTTATTGTRAIAAARIERGVTTEQQMIDQLGPPQGRGLDSQGRKMLTWNRMDVEGTGKSWIPIVGPFLPGATKVHKQQLAVSFDARGRVVESRVINEESEANIMGETDRQ